VIGYPAVTQPVETRYSVEVDTVGQEAWYAHVAEFADGNLYQLWLHRPEREGVSRLLLRDAGTVVAAAEARLFTLPGTSRGIAYVRWGPLWRRHGARDDREILRHALRALRQGYAVRRGMVLRVVPRLTVEDHPYCTPLAAEEHYVKSGAAASQRTLLMPLSASLDDLRDGLDQKWRNRLNRAERAGLTVTGGNAPELFDQFTLVYEQMLARKRLGPTADLQRHRHIQASLPPELKMEVLLAHQEGRLCAGMIASAIGDTAVYLFGATNELGMQTSASYLLQWELVKLLKQRGVREYDLNGIDPERNPGTYHFKQGLAGRNGRDVRFVGELESFRASLGNRVLLLLDRTRRRLRVTTP
jgi:hypothetical protein